MFRENPRVKAAVYVSDHSEVPGVGHAADLFEPEMTEIPMFLYLSETLRKQRSALEWTLRKNAGRRVEVSFDEPLNTDYDGNELLLSDVLGTEADVVMRPLEDDVDLCLLASALDTLSPREREIITLRFGLGGGKEQTQKEVADRLGISQSYISRLEKRIIQRLKKEILRLS